MRKSIFYDKAKRSNKAKPDVSAWVKGICTVHESKRFTAIFYWIALVACLAVICSAFADAGNISIDGYVQPGEWQERRFPHCLAVSRRAAAPFRMRMCVRRRMSLPVVFILPFKS